MVCAAVVVMKSVLEEPVSAEKAIEVIVVVGAVESITRAAFAASDPVVPGAAKVRIASFPAASLIDPPLRVRAVLVSWSRSADVSPG